MCTKREDKCLEGLVFQKDGEWHQWRKVDSELKPYKMIKVGLPFRNGGSGRLLQKYEISYPVYMASNPYMFHNCLDGTLEIEVEDVYGKIQEFINKLSKNEIKELIKMVLRKITEEQ